MGLGPNKEPNVKTMSPWETETAKPFTGIAVLRQPRDLFSFAWLIATISVTPLLVTETYRALLSSQKAKADTDSIK